MITGADHKNRVTGDSVLGTNEALIQSADDLTQGQDWHDAGYDVVSFLSPTVYQQFYRGFVELFIGILIRAGLNPSEGFHPELYHHLVAEDYQKHLKVVSIAKLLEAKTFPIDLAIIENRVSEVLGFQVKSIKPYNQERVFHFRIIRPGAADYNPIHRDPWQEENRDAINIFVPLFGSNENSSLLLAPGSHLWPESWTERTKEGAKMNGIQFNVPGLKSSKKLLELIRPNPKENEMLIFSPYLLHGLSENKNKKMTRISLEMRFWKV